MEEAFELLLEKYREAVQETTDVARVRDEYRSQLSETNSKLREANKEIDRLKAKLDLAPKPENFSATFVAGKTDDVPF